MMALPLRMKIYTTHVKPGDPEEERMPVFVREGFNFFAFALTFIWALYHRLWIRAIVIFALNVSLAIMLKRQYIGQESWLAIQAAFQILIGFQANDWLRAALAKRGYIMSDVVVSDTLLRAEQRYFERYLASSH